MPRAQKIGEKLYTWCLHCERTFLSIAAKKDRSEEFGEGELCPYPGCDGTMLDFWKWSTVRRDGKGVVRYVEIPVHEEVYPL